MQEVYTPGDSILCRAEGNPVPTLEWKNEETEEVFPGATLSITAEMVGETQSFLCTASNLINGTLATDTISITFDVIGEYCLNPFSFLIKHTQISSIPLQPSFCNHSAQM